MKKYRIQTVPTKQGAFIRRRIDKNRHRAEAVGLIYLIATAVISIWGNRALFYSVYESVGLKQFYKSLLTWDIATPDGIIGIVTSLMYVVMMVALFVNGLRALTHLKNLFKKKVSRVYGLNANIDAMESLGSIFSSSFAWIIITNLVIYLLHGQGGYTTPVISMYAVLGIGIAVHILCGHWGGKVSVFYIDEEAGVIERRRPFGRIIPLVRNVLQIASVFYMAYLFLTSESIRTTVQVYLLEGGLDSLMANLTGLLPVLLQVISLIWLAVLICHAVGTSEYSVEGPYAFGAKNFRIFSLLLAITSGLTFAFKYFLGEAVYTIAGETFSVATETSMDMNAAIIAAVAFVMFLIDCIIRLKWTKEMAEEEDESAKVPLPPVPNVRINLPPPGVNVSMPAPQPTPVNVYVPQQQLPAMPPINVHVPRQNTAVPNVNVHMPQQAPINVHVPQQAVPNVNVQMPQQAPVNVHVPQQAVPNVNVQMPQQAPVNVYVPQQQIPAMPPINVNIPRQAPAAAQPINIQMPAQQQQPMAMPPINIQMPVQKQQPVAVPPINVHVPAQQQSAAMPPINIQMPVQKQQPVVVPPINVNVPAQQQSAAMPPINIQMPAQKQQPVVVPPINVHVPAQAATPITVNMPAQQMTMPPINVQMPAQVPTPITVNMPAQKQQPVAVPPINVQMPAQAPTPINVHVPAQTATPIMVNMPTQQQSAAPINVNVPAASTPVNVNVPAAQPTPVNVHMPEQKQQSLTIPPLSVLHLENERPQQQTAQQPMPPINIHVPEQPAPQIVCPMGNKEETKEAVKEEVKTVEPEQKEETVDSIVAPAVVPVVAPVEAPEESVTEEVEEELPEPRDWQLRCPTCSSTLRVSGHSDYHRCPRCGKVLELHRKYRNVQDE